MAQEAKLMNNLDAINSDAARLLHLSKAAQNLLDELPFTDAEGKRIAAMDQLWAVLSSMEIQAQLHLDTVEDAIGVLKRPTAA